MITFAKDFIAVLVFIATYFFCYGVVFSRINMGSGALVAMLVAAFFAWIVSRWIFRKLGSYEHGIFGTVACWATIAGALGFFGGFVGPIIFTPESNQGPLLGFITGPLGFIGGGICGFIYALYQQKK